MTDTPLATQLREASQPPIVVLRQRLETRKGELANALVDITPDQFIRAVMTSVTLNQAILGCTWQSIWEACIKACRDGLLPDGVDGAIVPFKSTATWIPMYAGLLRRFRRSGQFKWVDADLVRKGDEFDYYKDEEGPHFRHVPGDDFNAPIEKVYALATTKEGGKFITVLSIAEANKIRNKSRASREDSPWQQWPEEMYKKTALRRLSKMLPSARDIIGEDDLSEVPTAARIERASPAQATPVTPGRHGPGEGDEQGAVDQSAAQQQEDRDPAVVEQEDPQHRAMLIAYQKGKEQKAQGHLKRAMPREYTESSRTREALAWTAGWEGQPMPTFFEMFEKEQQTGD